MTISSESSMSRDTRQVSGEDREYVTAVIAGQLCGIPVLEVHDVLRPQRITRVPLAPPEVEGSLNLRGRIVTSIDLRVRMSMPPRDGESESMSIVVEHGGELYSFKVDAVGEVMKVSQSDFQGMPATLDPMWRTFSQGVFRLKDRLLVLLDVDALLGSDRRQTAA